MKVKVRGIPAEGLKINRTCDPSEYGLADKDLGGLSPLTMDIRIERVGSIVLSDVLLKTVWTTHCARCLEPVRYPIDDHFQFNHTVTGGTEFIDLTDDIREEVILDLPIKILCTESSKGLCPGCGMNLNKEKCRCEKKQSKGINISIR